MSCLFPTRWHNDKPLSIEEFPDDGACAEPLAAKRWPDGFVCQRCGGGGRAWRLKSRPQVFKCAGDGERKDGKRRCRQASAVAGTIMHGTHVSLMKRFLAAYLVSTHSNGMSGLRLHSKLGLGSCKSAWTLLHKPALPGGDPNRKPLEGKVVIDGAFSPNFGGSYSDVYTDKSR